MAESKAKVYIVDDDEAVRDSLSLLMESESIPSCCYESAQAFVDEFDGGKDGCLLLDVRMPGMSGLELLDWLHEHGAQLPIIFITGHGDVPMAVDAMKRGAVDFIQKPFNDKDVLQRVHEAMDSSEKTRASRARLDNWRQRLESLTPREREVMTHVVAGRPNKVIALDLAISQRTVEIHRARVMHKMRVRSIAELVRVAALLDR